MLFWLLFQFSQLLNAADAAPCKQPVPLRYQVVHEIQRSALGFTQGLVYRDGFLYESTGGYGDSAFQKIHIDTGKIDFLGHLPKEQFGEGLESEGGVFYQLTWKEHRLIRWSESGQYLGETSFPYEGWGLAHDDLHDKWITSDGSSLLHVFDRVPVGGISSSDLSVMNGTRPEPQLNELEYAKGSIYANVFHDQRMIQIDPTTGCVTGELDLSQLMARSGIDLANSPDSVLNGIAYRADTGTFYVTGKNWSKIYEIRISG